MSSPSPRRRPSPAVYRRRRLVALLVLIVILAVLVAGVWTLIAQPWRGAAAEPQPSPSTSSPDPSPTTVTPPAEETPAATETTPPTPSASDTPQPESTAVAAPACTNGDLSVEAVTDKTEYAAGEIPQLSIALTNTGAADCTINVGTSAQSFTITSGSDVWWRSTDCQTEPSDMVVTLAAGQTVQSATPLPWDRTRSSVSSCDSPDRQRATGGTYHLAVSIGGVDSAQTKQFILY